MEILKIGLAILIGIGMIGTVLNIEKERKPITHGLAVYILIANGLLMYALLN